MSKKQEVIILCLSWLPSQTKVLNIKERKDNSLLNSLNIKVNNHVHAGLNKNHLAWKVQQRSVKYLVMQRSGMENDFVFFFRMQSL